MCVGERDRQTETETERLLVWKMLVKKIADSNTLICLYLPKKKMKKVMSFNIYIYLYIYIYIGEGREGVGEGVGEAGRNILKEWKHIDVLRYRNNDIGKHISLLGKKTISILSRSFSLSLSLSLYIYIYIYI